MRIVMNGFHHLAQLEPTASNASHNKDAMEVNGKSHASGELEETKEMTWKHVIIPHVILKVMLRVI